MFIQKRTLLDETMNITYFIKRERDILCNQYALHYPSQVTKLLSQKVLIVIKINEHNNYSFVNYVVSINT